MISVAEFEKLVDELLQMEDELERLGNVSIETSEGLYFMREQRLWGNVPQQREYGLQLQKVKKARRVVDAFNVVAQYKLALEGKVNATS